MDSLLFHFSFIDDVFEYFESKSASVLDILDQNLSKTLGHLTVLPGRENFERKALAVLSAFKRPPERKEMSPVKPKVSKPQFARQEAVTKPNNSNSLSEFQQDPNDLIGTMQSLDSGEKLFSCKLCGLQGKQKPNVRRHIVNKHMQSLQETYSCSLCEKSMTTRQSLKNHYMSSHGMNDKLAVAAIHA